MTTQPPGGDRASWFRRQPSSHWRWGVVAGYMLLIFSASSVSGVSMPAFLYDKVLHAGLYAVLSSLLVWALTEGDWRRTTGRTVVVATVVAVVYGWTDEVHQLFVPTRQFDWLDLAADATGAWLAASLLWAWGIISRGNQS